MLEMYVWTEVSNLTFTPETDFLWVPTAPETDLLWVPTAPHPSSAAAFPDPAVRLYNADSYCAQVNSCGETLPAPRGLCCDCSCQNEDQKPTIPCFAEVATTCCQVSLQSHKLQLQLRNSLPCFTQHMRFSSTGK